MHGIWALTLRTLRSDARLLRFHAIHLVSALIAILVLFFFYEGPIQTTAPGRMLLLTLLRANWMLVTTGGVLLFGPVITEEKEAGTLPLLRMTGIGPAAVVLGCSLPRLIQVGLALLVQFPVLCLSVTLGGADWSHVWMAMGLVYSQTIFIATLGILNSVIFRTSGKAIAATIGISVLWPTLIQSIRLQTGVGHSLSLDQMFQNLGQSSTRSTGIMGAVIAHTLVSSILMILAILLLDRLNQHEALEEPHVSLWDRIAHHWRSCPTNSPQSTMSEQTPVPPVHSEQDIPGKSRPSNPVWQNSIAWKEFFLNGSGTFGFQLRSAIAALVAVSLMGCHVYLSSWNAEDLNTAVQSIALFLLSADVIYHAVNLFGAEIRGQTWESLLILPVSLRSIARQKIQGAAWHILPWGVLLGLEIILSGTLGEWIYEYQRAPLVTVFVVIQATLQIMAFLGSLVRLSLWANPFMAALMAAAIHATTVIALFVSALLTFGIFGPPPTTTKIVTFNCTWIVIELLYIRWLLNSIRRRLESA